jgi:hypothetical protein
MNTNLYLVEKLDSAHREEMLQSANAERRSARAAHSSTRTRWHAVAWLGALLVSLRLRLERGARRGGQLAG